MSGFQGITVDGLTVRRAQRGDRVARAAICEAFAAPVLTLCRRLCGNQHLAEDLTQETFVEVLRHLADFRGDAGLATWVRRIAVSRCLMHQRSAWARRATPLDAQPEPLSQADTLASLGAAEDLAAAMEQLPDTARVVVWLHDVEGYTHAEIARATGRSVSFSKSCLSRARQALLAWRQTQEHEIAHAACAVTT